ncbi:MAG: hypothetical protein AB7E49_11470, partial [Campylobacterales bacterium]
MVQRPEFEELTELFLDADVRVSMIDPESYEILFLNQSFDQAGCEGSICYKVFRTSRQLCEWCPMERMKHSNSPGVHEYEMRDEATGRWYRQSAQFVTLKGGRTVKVDVGIDVTGLKA